MVLSPRMPALTALEVFLAVAKTGSLGAAGRELGLTQQAVSARITSIEALSGVTLLTRSVRGSALTPAGVVVAEWADRLLDAAEQFDAGLAALRSERRTRLRVVASLTVAEQLMPRWLVSWQAAATGAGGTAPEVILTAANSEQAVAAVRDHSADVGFIESPVAPSSLRSRVVARDELVLVVAPTHRWARRTAAVGPDELARTPLVAREPGSGTRDSLTAALRAGLGEAVEQAAPVLELSSAAAVRGAVLADAGPAVMSALTVADDLAVGRLRAVAVTGLDLHRELRAVWDGGRTPPAGPVRDLLAHIGAAAGRQQPAVRRGSAATAAAPRPNGA